MSISSSGAVNGSASFADQELQNEHAVLALLKAVQPTHKSKIDAVYWRWSHARVEDEQFGDFLIRQGIFDSHRQLASALSLFHTGMHLRSPMLLSGLLSQEKLIRMVEQTRSGDTSIFARAVDTIRDRRDAGATETVSSRLQETRREDPPFLRPHDADIAVPEEIPDGIPLTTPLPPGMHAKATDSGGFEVISETEVIVATSEEAEKPGGWMLPAFCFLNSGNDLLSVLPAGTFLSCFLTPRDGEPIRLWPSKKYTFGSSADCDIVIPAQNIASRQAQISYSDYGFKLYDLERQGAVVVNGESTAEVVLNDQDEIRIGETVFHFLSGEESRMLRLFSLRFEDSVSVRSRKANDRFGAATAFSGDLADIPMADLLQFLCSTRKTGSFLVASTNGDAQLVLTDGHVTFAQMGNAEGPEVVYQLLAWTQGTFRFGRIEDFERRKRNVSSTTVLLVMEGMRRLDEAKQNREISAETH